MDMLLFINRRGLIFFIKGYILSQFSNTLRGGKKKDERSGDRYFSRPCEGCPAHGQGLVPRAPQQARVRYPRRPPARGGGDRHGPPHRGLRAGRPGRARRRPRRRPRLRL